MRVLVLADNLATAAPIHRQIARSAGIRATVLVTNEQGHPKAVFWLRQVALAARALRANRRAAIGALAHTRLTTHRLHDGETLGRLRNRCYDVGIHALGVIYRRPALEAFRLGILNGHIGLLPRYRGRSVMEWSLLHGDPTGVSVFCMDEGIDTGARIVLRRNLPLWGATVTEAKRQLFAAGAALYGESIAALMADPQRIDAMQRPEEGTRFYVMSELFLGVVEQLLPDRPPGALPVNP